MDAPKLKIVVVGHVDHGKSTLIGRIFFDTDSMPEGKIEAIRKASEAEGMPFEYAFLLDALLEEQEQNITIDTTQIPFRTAKREYVIIDAPGHKEFLKNMITGAASADAAILLIAASEGVKEQSRRHGYLLRLLGVRQVVVAVNKMDLVGYDKTVYDTVTTEYREFLAQIGLSVERFIPVSAREGDNIARPATHKMPWYNGPTILETLDDFTATAPPIDQPLRFPVQDVYRFDARRVLAGRIETGILHVGDTLTFYPGGKSSQVATIERWNGPQRDFAIAGESVGITLTEQLFVQRGMIAGHEALSVNTGHPQLSYHPLFAGTRVRGGTRLWSANTGDSLRDSPSEANHLSREQAEGEKKEEKSEKEERNPDAQHPIPNTQYPTPNTQHPRHPLSRGGTPSRGGTRLRDGAVQYLPPALSRGYPDDSFEFAERRLPNTHARFAANIFWMGPENLTVGERVRLKLATQEVTAQVAVIDRVMDAATLETVAERNFLTRNDVAEVVIETEKPVAFDLHEHLPTLGRFVLVQNRRVSGGGIVTGDLLRNSPTERPGVSEFRPSLSNPASSPVSPAPLIRWADTQVSVRERAERNGHRAAIVWLTGLSGAGKSTIAAAVNRALFERGWQVTLLDGDNLRHGLCADLGFSPEDRAENIRRTAHVARLFAESGFITLTAFISPYRADRDAAREVAKQGNIEFLEVFVNAPVAVCEERDPKGLYKRARAGEIREFTGISAPYEAPTDPELTLETAEQTIEESVMVLANELLRRLAI